MFKTHWPVLGGGGVLLLLTGVIGPVLFFAASWIPQTEDSYGSSHLLGDSSPCQAPIATGLELWQWTLDCRNAENLNGGGGGVSQQDVSQRRNLDACSCLQQEARTLMRQTSSLPPVQAWPVRAY